MKTLQASMILRNEEEMLPRALDSLKGIDSIMICDTGSSDKSFDIYKQYQAKSYNLEWFKYSRFNTEDHIKDFSHARNECKEKCTGDWLFILDGDEYCNFDIKKVKDMVNSGWVGDYDVLRADVQTTISVPESDNIIETSSQPRIFRNKDDIWYYSAYHNTLMMWPEGRDKMPAYFTSTNYYKTSFLVIADNSPNHKKHPNRTLDILTDALKKNPGDARAMYYLAQEWTNRREPIKALFYLKSYTDIAPPSTESAEAWFLIATIYIDLGMLGKASEAALKSVFILPSYKQAWELIHGLSTEMFKPYWKKMLDGADNEHLMIVRK